jgi:hypothetical protein
MGVWAAKDAASMGAWVLIGEVNEGAVMKGLCATSGGIQKPWKRKSNALVI